MSTEKLSAPREPVKSPRQTAARRGPVNDDAKRLSPDQAATLRKTYIECVTKLNISNSTLPDWWLTWLSSRDRFRPRTWDRMVALARIAVARERTGKATFSNLDAPTAEVAHRWLGSAGPSWLGRARAALADTWLFAKVAGRALVNISAARRYPARQSPLPVDVVIATILMEHAVSRKGAYEDIYFGSLHEALTAKGQQVLYCGFPEGNAARIFAAAASRHDVLIVGYAHILTFVDVGRAVARAVGSRFAVPQLPLPWGGDAAPLVRADLRLERISILEGYLIRLAMQRLLQMHPRARLINMYENNGWERANYQAARTAVPARPVTGYLHCAILRSHMKNRFPREEHALRPMPDRVVTTGQTARDLLLDIGDYPPELVVVGCGLRAPLLSQVSQLPPPRRPVRTVLVLFEGLVSIIPAMQLYERAAKARPDLRFLVRCHPQFPIEQLSLAAQVRYGSGEAVDVSRPAALGDAVAEADVVAYVSTTAVLYALYGGRPVIKIDIDETLDDDPLTDCPVFKWRAATAEQFSSALAELDAMPANAAAQQLDAARRYLESYLHEPYGSALDPFLRPPVIG
jgi:hypothetical protein